MLKVLRYGALLFVGILLGHIAQRGLFGKAGHIDVEPGYFFPVSGSEPGKHSHRVLFNQPNESCTE